MRLLLDGEIDLALQPLLERCAAACALAEGLRNDCAAALAFIDDQGIRAINADQRQIDLVTDVLSFPTVSYPPGITAGLCPELLAREWDSGLAACFLGDILICLPQAERQALDYGHGLKRELCYLLTHGLMHLFGYDHLKEDDRTIMRQMEERALAQAGQSLVSDGELLRLAREVKTRAYAPYSGFRVGACLLTPDGKVYQGCNVENASYGLTNCAERTAVFKAVSEGEKEFVTLAIAADAHPPWPCGACRQVLSEFAPQLRVLVTWGDDLVVESTLTDLLPNSFSPSSGVQQHLGREKHG